MEAQAQAQEFVSHSGEAKKYLVNRSLVQWLLTLSTAAAMGTFAFLWKINATFAAYQERDQQKTETINEIKTSIYNLSNDVNGVKEKLIKIETIQNEQVRQQAATK